MRLFPVLFAVLLVGCGSSGGSSGAAKKPFASSWVRQSDGAIFNFTGLQIGATQDMYFAIGQGSCRCTISTAGSETAGNFSTVLCSWVGGGSGDPGCASLNSNGTWVKGDSTLTLCGTHGCADFH